MKAMVLCAGYGTRLGDLTRETPKPMLSLGSGPMLEYIVRHLVRHHFDEIAVNLHFRPELIRDHFLDGSRWGARLTYCYEPQLLGTAGAVKNMAQFLADERDFLIHYGDVVTNHDLSATLRFHRERNALATLLVHQRVGSNSAVVMDNEGRITRFLERPSAEQRRAAQSPWVFSGIVVASPALLDQIPASIARDLPRDVFPGLVSTGRVFGFPLSGFRCAVDSPERLAEARAAAARGALG